MFKAIWLWLTHYKVCVQWDEDFMAVHYAKTFDEAIEWTRQYPRNDVMVLIGKRTKLLAARGCW
jgi:hypothetical protein